MLLLLGTILLIISYKIYDWKVKSMAMDYINRPQIFFTNTLFVQLIGITSWVMFITAIVIFWQISHIVVYIIILLAILQIAFGLLFSASIFDLIKGIILLKKLGSKNNFTFIAENITKYYLELKKNHADDFDDEVSLLASAGIIDAQNYINQQEIKQDEIVSMAENSVTEGGKPLINFIIDLEIKILKVDNPKMDISTIKNACEKQRQNIENAVQKVKNEYNGEPQFSLTVDMYMQTFLQENASNKDDDSEDDFDIDSDTIHKNATLLTELLENAITTPITFEDVASIDDEEIQLLGLGLQLIKKSNPNVDPININQSLKVISDCGIELPKIEKTSAQKDKRHKSQKTSHE